MSKDLNNEIDVAICALQSIKLFHDHYGPSTPSIKHIQEVIQMLDHQGKRNKMGPYGGLLVNIADAISRTFFGKRIDNAAKELADKLYGYFLLSQEGRHSPEDIRLMILKEILKARG